MADTILTVVQIENFFQHLTLELIGLDPAVPESQGRVRITWPEKGAPAWKRTEDICFLQISPVADSYTQQVESSYSPQGMLIQSYTEVIAVTWVFYGPNSFDDSRKVRIGLFKPSSFEALSLRDTFLVTDVPQPVRSPELFNGQWWDRSNLFARFNIKSETRETMPNIEIADIHVIPNN